MPFIRIFGLINAFVVENVRQQRELEQHVHVSPVLSSEGGLVHRVLASRFAKGMGFADGELPALDGAAPDSERDFGADVLPIHSGEVYKMATYVAGGDPHEDVEVIVQRWVARRFHPRYDAAPAVRDAARLIGGWHRRGPLTALASIWSSKLHEAKALIAQSVPPDLHVAYAPTLLLPYIVKCLERMRQLGSDPTLSECLSPEMVVAGCLASPRFAFRTCTADVEVSFSGRPLPQSTLIILPARRLRATGDGSSAFCSDDESRYPALRLIRRLLTRVWIASREVHNPAAQSLAAATARATVQAARAKASKAAPAAAAGVVSQAATSRGIVPPHAEVPVFQHAVSRQAMSQHAMSQHAMSQHALSQPELEPTVVRPAPVQPVAQAGFEPHPVVPHAVAEPTLQSAPPELSSLTRTLPFGNDLGTQRRRAGERRGRKARALSKAGDRTVPGPF
jgi:hypothetical protein